MISFLIEALYLAALAMVPLSFGGDRLFYWFSEPKTFILHAVAVLILALWSVEWLRAGSLGVVRIPRHSPARALLIAVFSLVGLTAISTLNSPMPVWSFLGRDPNNPAGELYSVLSYAVIFAAVALRVRRRAQIERIFWTVALTGGIAAAYGALQYTGNDPFSKGAGVVSTLGNPIYFGSYLIMSAGSVLALMGMESGWGRFHSALLGLMALYGGAFFCAGVKGPQLGVLVALALATIMVALFAYRWKDGKLVVAGSVVFALGFLLVPVLSGGAATVVQPVTQAVVSAPNNGTVTPSISGGPVQAVPVRSSLNARIGVWRASGELALPDGWPWIGADSGEVLRPLTGYGPGMAYYALPLTLPPQHEFLTYDSAHNGLVQALLETGWLGMLALLAIAALSVWVAFGIAGQRRHPSHLRYIVGMVMLAIFAGRFVEQLVGVARVSDSLTWWAMLGLVIALSRIGEPEDLVEVQPRQRALIGYAMGMAAITGASLLVMVDFRQAAGSVTAAGALKAYEHGQVAEARRGLERAIEWDPLAADYPIQLAALIERSGEPVSAGREARSVLIEARRHVPLNHNSQIRLAMLDARLIAAGEWELVPEFEVIMDEIVLQLPPFPFAQGFAGQGYIAVGKHEKALAAADRTIAMEGYAPPVVRSQAWWVRGNALEALGRIEGLGGAIEAYHIAVERDPGTFFAGMAREGLGRLEP